MHTATASTAGRIGPNAITRVAQVLPARIGAAQTLALFEAAGLAQRLREPPEDMVPEGEVRQLHVAMRAQLGPQLSAEVARAAGVATGSYLLARRIPQKMQWVLRRLPARLAARVLLAAITRNAWTFVGSGQFSARAARPDGAPGETGFDLEVQRNPLCLGQRTEGPVCDYYAAVFERLFSALVHPQAQVREVACEARGDAACRFEVRWPA
jgi:divinyl protochlorophyllide a 8-vinyl-reductase